VNPAIGVGGRLPRWTLVRRYGFALVLILVLGVAKFLVAQKVISVVSLIPPQRAVASGLLIGPDPDDSDLEEFAADLDVGAVVNLAGPNVAEQVTAASLHQAYLYLAVPPGAAPTWAQLLELTMLMHRTTERGGLVYVHDDSGGPRAVTAAAMLLLLRGRTWATMSAEITPAALGSLNGPQRLALAQLWSVLSRRGRSPAGNPYATARLEPW